jgi:hypothetical protein
VEEFYKLSGCAAKLEYYGSNDCSAKLCCDNKGALNRSSQKRKHIKSSSSCADIWRSVRTTKQTLSTQFTYEHVAARMDDVRLWHQLILEQRLNCICDNLAKAAVQKSFTHNQIRTEKQTLPREGIAVFVGGEKMTSGMDKAVRYDISKQQARKFLTEEIKPSKRWTDVQFDEVAWDWLDGTLASKPDGYTTWLSKQHTGFCGTRL